MRNKLAANLVLDMYARPIVGTAVHSRLVDPLASTDMANLTALSGKEHPNFDTHAFMKSFVAGLVLRNRSSVRPLSPSDRRGFAQVIRLLDQKIDELDKAGKDRKIIRDLVRIANDLRASNTGGYEGFESALRGLQLTFASCPNPFYEEIAFSVPRPYAETTVGSLPLIQRDLVNEVAEAFVEAAGG